MHGTTCFPEIRACFKSWYDLVLASVVDQCEQPRSRKPAKDTASLSPYRRIVPERLYGADLHPDRLTSSRYTTTIQLIPQHARSFSFLPIAMTFTWDRLLRRPSVSEEDTRGSIALPRFTFESDDRPLVSTERLFRQWDDEETQYDHGYQNVEQTVKKEQDIIVSDPLQRIPHTKLTNLADHLGRIKRP